MHAEFITLPVVLGIGLELYLGLLHTVQYVLRHSHRTVDQYSFHFDSRHQNTGTEPLS